MIHVLATIRVAPGRQDDFLRAFHELVPQVLAEAGCLEYGPAVDLETPISGLAPSRPDTVTVVEKWESVEALVDHLAAPHLQKYRETVQDIVTGVEIRVLRPA